MRASRKAFLPAAFIAAAVSLGLVLFPCTSAFAEEPRSDETPGDLARESIEQMMRALQLLVDSIPQYEVPEMLENGDIIIRRKNPLKPREAEKQELDETAT